MEKNVVKVIREAFKIAYLNKLLKESSEEIARKMDPNDLAQAEAKYPRWISGRLRDFRWGNADGLSNIAQNYLIEKAVEEYKQTGDKRIHDAISMFYYPAKKSLLHNYITGEGKGSRSMHSNVIMGSLKKANKINLIDDLLLNAWTQSLGDVSQFDKDIEGYTKDNPNGIGPFLRNKFELEAKRLAMKAQTVKLGGKAGFSYLDEPGYDSEGGRKLDLPGGIEVDAETSAQSSGSQLEALYSTFKQAKKEIAQDDSVKNPFLKLVLLNYLDGKKAFETVAENPEIVDQIVARKAEKKGGDVVAALKQVKNEANSYPINYFQPGVGKYYTLLEKIGIENGLPSDWLKSIYAQSKFIEIAKFISSHEGSSSEPKYKEPGQDKDDGLVFEKFLNENMETIMKEVQRRIGK